MDNNIFQHNLGDASTASSNLFDKLQSVNTVQTNRISPTVFVCSVDENGVKTCHLVVSNDQSHFFNPISDNQFSLPSPIAIPDEPVEPTEPASCTCPTCGAKMDSENVNDPSIPDDIEIVAIVKPADIFGHIPDSELNESVQSAIVGGVAKAVACEVAKQVISKIAHTNKTKEGASKLMEAAMCKKYNGAVKRQSPTAFTHLREDGTCDKVLTEDTEHCITSYKM